MADTPARTPTRRAQPPLVGREREQALLRDQLAAALAGEGGLVLIGGEAGIGKTALAEALGREASERGALVLVGRCYDLTETPPYGPWIEAFECIPAEYDRARLPPPLGGGDPAASQAALFAQMRNFLAVLAAQRPMVLLLDDLHWADPASLDLLRSLARQLAILPLLLVVTYRADELTRRHPLYQLLPLLAREARATQLDLRALPGQAVRELVGARYALSAADEGRLAAYLRERAAGHPLFVGELLRTLEEEGVLHPADGDWALGDLGAVRVPRLLRQTIEGRLARLGDERERLLAIAAVIGQEVPLDLWAMASGTDHAVLLDVVERAVEARLLDTTPAGTSVRFAHALIREALYEGVLPPRRRAWHLRIGEALAGLPSPDLDAVAAHFQRAGEARAVGWLVRAGERAQRAYAWLTAAARYQAALALLGEDADRAGERGWLLNRLGHLYLRSDARRSLDYQEEAGRVAAAAGDCVLAAVALADRGMARSALERFARGAAEFEAALAALESLDAAERARLAGLHATGAVAPVYMVRASLIFSLARAGRYAEAVALGEQVLAQHAERPRVGALHMGSGVATANLGLALALAALGQPDAARDAFARSLAAHRAIGQDPNIAATMFFALLVVELPYLADDVVARRRVAAEGERAWARSVDVVAGVAPRLAWLPLLALDGQWAEARALAAAARAAVIVAPYATRVVLGPLARAQGDADLAWAVVREALPGGPSSAPGDTSYLPALAAQRLAAALALDAGDLPAVRQWLAAHDRWLAWAGAVLGQAEGQTLWAAYHRAAGDLHMAHQHAERALTHATEPRQPLALLSAHRLCGELATAAGRHDDAAAHLAQALALADACAAPHERALTLLASAELRAATGGVNEAAALLDEVRLSCASLDARPALARAEALAARLAAAPPPAPAYPAGLTAREMEVLRLVADGLSDAQVAARLFVSPRTVNAHLRSIYSKLDVPSRGAAIRFALLHRLA